LAEWSRFRACGQGLYTNTYYPPSVDTSDDNNYKTYDRFFGLLDAVQSGAVEAAINADQIVLGDLQQINNSDPSVTTLTVTAGVFTIGGTPYRFIIGSGGAAMTSDSSIAGLSRTPQHLVNQYVIKRCGNAFFGGLFDQSKCLQAFYVVIDIAVVPAHACCKLSNAHHFATRH
jgi:hypothetical protein